MKKPKTIPSTIHFPNPLKQKLKKEAKEEKRSFHQHVIRVLENHVEQVAQSQAAGATA
jgi:hypothetical protein